MINIQSTKAYSDNYIWLITTNEGNLVIDPGESQPVINYLQKHTLTLTDILITHHHFSLHDHQILLCYEYSLMQKLNS